MNLSFGKNMEDDMYMLPDSKFITSLALSSFIVCTHFENIHSVRLQISAQKQFFFSFIN